MRNKSGCLIIFTLLISCVLFTGCGKAGKDIDLDDVAIYENTANFKLSDDTSSDVVSETEISETASSDTGSEDIITLIPVEDMNEDSQLEETEETEITELDRIAADIDGVIKLDDFNEDWGTYTLYDVDNFTVRLYSNYEDIEYSLEHYPEEFEKRSSIDGHDVYRWFYYGDETDYDYVICLGDGRYIEILNSNSSTDHKDAIDVYNKMKPILDWEAENGED